MLCCWGVKADVACLQVKLCVAISERFRKCICYLKVLYSCPGLLYFTFTLHTFKKIYSAVKTLHLYVVCAVDACDLFDVGKFIVKRQN